MIKRPLSILCLCAALVASVCAATVQTPAMVLSFFIGTWVGTTTFTHATKEMKEVTCSIQGSREVAGKYLQLDVNTFFAGTPEEELLMVTYDPITHLYEAWTFNQHTAGAHLTTGVPEKDPNKIVLSSPGILINGENTAYRETFLIEKKDQFSVTYEMRHYDQKTSTDVWTVVYKSEYTKKA